MPFMDQQWRGCSEKTVVVGPDCASVAASVLMLCGMERQHPTLRRRRPTYNEDLVTRVASLVELERRLKQEEPPPIGVRVANTKFWAKMRDILFVNRTAVGVEQLDDLMTAVIRDDSDAAQDFNGLIIRLPPTSLQQTGRASSSHPAFEEMMRDEGLKD
ncbi:hypothetical protein PC129_g23461 [Phytophthora cactorum]|uniref:Uncharacterized protein n=1 Tax=Phytophthora cactorum TaxID=29920 RepID=A0A8T0XYJ8_9STRA|nr:hypothetical protein PC113_g23702 [Phytophthora cactorum]KAG3180454.1 hypothetical protein C6341_g6900 [Phytophthora cactorum]KAG3201646.1 hypothetical protein PC129_g23461 [Phytophthora cactorum]